MDDENRLANEGFQSEDDLKVFDNPMVPSEKPKRNLRLIFGISAIAICSCLVIGGVIIAAGLNRVSTEKAPVEAVIDRFMREMLVEDIDAAYALYSPRA